MNFKSHLDYAISSGPLFQTSKSTVVGLLSCQCPLKVSYGIGEEEHDQEGRVIVAEYDAFVLVTAYVPNTG